MGASYNCTASELRLEKLKLKIKIKINSDDWIPRKPEITTLATKSSRNGDRYILLGNNVTSLHYCPISRIIIKSTHIIFREEVPGIS